MWRVVTAGLLVLAVLPWRRARWAYSAFVLFALLRFPAQVGFHLRPRACELTTDAHFALVSMTNYAHIALFAAFFVISYLQFRENHAAILLSALATVIIGALVEIAEGVVGTGHCRVRDLIPDSAGALLGAAAVMLWTAARGSILSHHFLGRRNA